MRDEERTLKECLIEAGFWGEEEGDPTADEHSLGIVLARMQERLARGFYISFESPSVETPGFETIIVGMGERHALASGKDLAEALCNGALALPDFLKDHPECAAG